MAYLPPLRTGEYQLIPRAINSDGEWADLPQSTVKIID